MSSIGLSIAILSTSLFFILLLLLYFYLLFRKLHRQKRIDKKQYWIDSNKPHLQNYLESGKMSDGIIPKNSLEVEALEEYLSQVLKDIKLEVGPLGHLYHFVDKHFYNIYLKRLQNRRWSVRMNTLYFIKIFKMHSLKGEITRLLERRNCTQEEKQQIYLIFAALKDPYIDLILLNESNLPRFLCYEMMSEMMDTDHYEDYVKRFFTLPSNQQECVLEVLREKNYRSWDLLDLLERLLSSPDTSREIRIKVLKSISDFGYLKSPNLLLPLLNSVNERIWVEKVMLARVMGSIRKDTFVPYLEILLADEHYQVRYEAGKSLRKHRKIGEERLRWIGENHSDAFARDMAEEWLERSPEDE
ncbi:HEAT repeat domain-containing protein [Ammoniphilus sp. CFH 90114]|uniref:HEAT repeat domain-containing protein n=1 Tax=Ammoniphilus sp. CFH 90114 TaxID=2493665 RepID=UPI00100F0644|nr:HEAT repeat domain-containing protein [Ammoniphilus sp. CFH 90114]RXT06275.1 HEAT repeat domain-containing protein [Ammoniphilus sp. CFH 90114]